MTATITEVPATLSSHRLVQRFPMQGRLRLNNFPSSKMGEMGSCDPLICAPACASYLLGIPAPARMIQPDGLDRFFAKPYLSDMAMAVGIERKRFPIHPDLLALMDKMLAPLRASGLKDTPIFIDWESLVPVELCWEMDGILGSQGKSDVEREAIRNRAYLTAAYNTARSLLGALDWNASQLLIWMCSRNEQEFAYGLRWSVPVPPKSMNCMVYYGPDMESVPRMRSEVKRLGPQCAVWLTTATYPDVLREQYQTALSLKVRYVNLFCDGTVPNLPGETQAELDEREQAKTIENMDRAYDAIVGAAA